MFKLISTKKFLENQKKIIESLQQEDKLIIISDYFNRIKTRIEFNSNIIIVGADLSMAEKPPRYDVFKFEDVIVSSMPINQAVLKSQNLFNIFASKELGLIWKIHPIELSYLVKLEEDTSYKNIYNENFPKTKKEILYETSNLEQKTIAYAPRGM